MAVNTVLNFFKQSQEFEKKACELGHQEEIKASAALREFSSQPTLGLFYPNTAPPPTKSTSMQPTNQSPLELI